MIQQNLIDSFYKNEWTCLIAKDGDIIFTSFDKGIKPLLDYYQGQGEAGNGKYPRGELQLVDKVIGKGAAILCQMIGIREIHTDVVSLPALGALARYGIKIQYGELTDHIANAKKDGQCPVESIAMRHGTPETFYPALLAFINCGKVAGDKAIC